LLIAALVIFVAIGCERFDYQLRVHNGTARVLLVRVNPGYNEAQYHAFVREIEPGADGVPVAWHGSRENLVEVLDPSCKVLGTLHSQDGVTYTLPGVDGFSATIEPADNSLPAPSDHKLDANGPMRWSTDCGGDAPNVD